MRMKTQAALGAALLLASSLAIAANNAAPADADAPAQAMQVELEDTVSNYVGASQKLMGAQAALMASLGMQAEADQMAAASQALAPDAARAALEQAARQQDAAGAALAGRMKGAATLDSAGQQKFADALRELAEGYTQYAAMDHDLASARQRPDGADAGSEQFVARRVPAAMQAVLKTLHAGVAFSKANGIAVSPVVTEILSRR